MAKVAVSRQMFADILTDVSGCGHAMPADSDLGAGDKKGDDRQMAP